MVSVQFPSCVTKMFAPSTEKQFAKAVFSAPTNARITAVVANALNWIKEWVAYTGSNREIKRTLNAAIANPNDKTVNKFLASVTKATTSRLGSTASVATVAQALVNQAPKSSSQAAVMKLIQQKFQTNVWTPRAAAAAISSAAVAGAGIAAYFAPEKTIHHFITKTQDPVKDYFTATTIGCSIAALATIAAMVKYRAGIINSIKTAGSVIRHPINSLSTARTAAGEVLSNAKDALKAKWAARFKAAHLAPSPAAPNEAGQDNPKIAAAPAKKGGWWS